MNFIENKNSMVKKHKKDKLLILFFVSLHYNINIILYIKFITIVIIYYIKKRIVEKK